MVSMVRPDNSQKTNVYSRLAIRRPRTQSQSGQKSELQREHFSLLATKIIWRGKSDLRKSWDRLTPRYNQVVKDFFLREISLFLGGGRMEGGEQDRGQEVRLHDEQESIVREPKSEQRRHGPKISRAGHFVAF